MSLAERYLEAVKQCDVAAYGNGQTDPNLLITREGRVTVEYAPFDYIESGAQLVIVGLTPGRTQATNAISEMQKRLLAGDDLMAALIAAKRFASFSGSMRSALVRMLDKIRLPQVYGHGSAYDFFSDNARVHFTSSLRYPVYVDGKNYSGNPAPLKTASLLGQIDTHLAEEAATLPDATWIPLGKHAEAALSHLCEKGRLKRDQVLIGLPHPSGANAERIAYFLGTKPREQLSVKTNPTTIDTNLRRLVRQVERLSE